MIRPITVLTFILACGSGMYLYHAKHRVDLLDQQIDRTVKQTEALREQSRALHAEWMLLNDPERLRRLAARYLPTLQPVAPTQFTDLADLDSRLPPVAPTPPAATEAVVASAAAAAPTSDQTASGASAEDQAATIAPGQSKNGGTDHASGEVIPVPRPAPVAAPSVDVASAPLTAPVPPADHALRPGIAQARRAGRTPRPAIAQVRPLDRARRPAIAQARPADRMPRPMIAQALHTAARAADISSFRPQPVVAAARIPQHVPVWKPATRHPVIAEAAPPRFMPSERRSMPLMRPRTMPQSEFGGSMLGMAHGMSNLPRPLPVDAAYNSSNSGG